MKFESSHVAAFCAASYDLNPLHTDAKYALRTQFGKPVIYGMAGVLWALGNWAEGRSFRLHSLHAVFRKPLFEGIEYEFAIQEVGDALTLRFYRGPVDYAVIRCKFEWATDISISDIAPTTGFQPREAALEKAKTAEEKVAFSMKLDAFPKLKAAFGISQQSFPVAQLSTLLWASYHVGMELPGKQALFSEFQVSFEADNTNATSISLDLAAAQFDDRFNRYVQTGKGKGISQFRIVAFQRPEPVDFTIQEMPRFSEGTLPLDGKRVFISGATRGFGAALARMCALAGARLALNYRGNAEKIASLVEELRKTGTEVHTFKADMADDEAVHQLSLAIKNTFDGLDFVFANAAPGIQNLQFLEQSNAEFQTFVGKNLAISLATTRFLLPLMDEGGTFTQISSVYLTKPVAGFGHYLAAKAAQETLMESLSLEFRDVAFVNARLPRILTDQTNLPFDFDPPSHPGKVAKSLILQLASDEMQNYQLLELPAIEE